ncbi:MAG: 5-formyltetrahydrofolate cyclo-ligase [Zoogloeaceae bacterium]|jgi:5,10-methenyltetrahydrofolate synthetase|nr:5-formyltetrahydrofolate cyclo-ligase [Zoogloeaceae bacterium]
MIDQNLAAQNHAEDLSANLSASLPANPAGNRARKQAKERPQTEDECQGEDKSDPLREQAEALRRALRQRMLARREALTPEEVARLSAAVSARLLATFPVPPEGPIAFCWPIRNEPDIRAALLRWQADGITLALPVAAPGMPLRFRAWRPETPLCPDRYGIPAPAKGAYLIPRTLLIPVNAFNRDGFRLGYGGGFFDRTLATLIPRPLAIGVGFDLSQTDNLPPQAHDQPLDWIITETRGSRFPLPQEAGIRNRG